jgi:hypothetical protein
MFPLSNCEQNLTPLLNSNKECAGVEIDTPCAVEFLLDIMMVCLLGGPGLVQMLFPFSVVRGQTFFIAEKRWAAEMVPKLSHKGALGL